MEGNESALNQIDFHEKLNGKQTEEQYNQRDIAVETHLAARASYFLRDRHVVASDHAVNSGFELREV